MTRELDHEMDQIANAQRRRAERSSSTPARSARASVMDGLLEHVDEVGESSRWRPTRTPRWARAPSLGHDLLIKYSPKTQVVLRGLFAAIPDCDVTYPLAQELQVLGGRRAVSGVRHAAGQDHQVQARAARHVSESVDCPTKKGPEIYVGKCPVDGADLHVRYSPGG